MKPNATATVDRKQLLHYMATAGLSVRQLTTKVNELGAGCTPTLSISRAMVGHLRSGTCHSVKTPIGRLIEVALGAPPLVIFTPIVLPEQVTKPKAPVGRPRRVASAA